MLGRDHEPLLGIKDFVIQRSDGSPLYNLAVAVDDRDMGITHVVRGQDHVSNTPRQLMLLRALGAEPPVYAHIPLLHGPDGKKLSKRHGAASVQEVREQGYLPEAIRNYIALLGWGYDESTTFMTTDELVERFALERVSKNPAVFDEQKLRWMNGRYMRELPVEELHRRLEEFTGREIPIEIVEISREKMQTLADFWPLAGSWWSGRATLRRRPGRRWGEGAAGPCWSSRDALGRRSRSMPRASSRCCGSGRAAGVKPKEVFQPLRVALTGTTVSPGIFESVRRWGARRRSRGSIKPCRKRK